MKTTAIVLLVIAGLMFGAFIGAVGGILLQSKIDKAVKEAEIGEKDKEIKALNNKLAEVSNNEEFIRNQTEQDIKDVFDDSYHLSVIETRELIGWAFGLAVTDMPKNKIELIQYIKNLHKLTQGKQPNISPGPLLEDVSFAHRVKDDNSPISHTAIFKPNDRRIYACFANKGVLSELPKVIIRWRNKTANEVVKLETKPLNPAASYNFIWLEKKQGWPAGEYLVELFDTKTLALIAQGTFTALAEEKNDELKDDESDKSKKPEAPKKGSKVLVDDKYIDTYKLVIEGGKISDDEAVNLEKALQENQDDFAARIKLLGYYSLKQFKSESARETRQKHVLWVIKNRPDSLVAGLPYASLNPAFDKKTYSEAKALWLKQVEAYKDNVSVLENAANFLIIFDRKKAEELLLKAQALEPGNPKWPKKLEFLHSLSKNREKKEEPEEVKPDKSKEPDERH